MNRATPEMRVLSQRVIEHEALRQRLSLERPAATFGACEKLRPLLATLMGHEGFRALLLRALTVASAEAPALRTLQVKADGSLEGWQAAAYDEKPGETAEAGGVLLAHLLGLLVAFIGAGLTLGVVREVWPKLSLTDPIPNPTLKE